MADTKNISSNEVEQGEIDKIATEIKQELTVPGASEQPDTNLLRKGKDDTIYIDREGIFHQTDHTPPTD
jgi:hypothetical protein